MQGLIHARKYSTIEPSPVHPVSNVAELDSLFIIIFLSKLRGCLRFDFVLHLFMCAYICVRVFRMCAHL